MAPRVDATPDGDFAGAPRDVGGGEPFEEFYRREFSHLLVVAGALVGPVHAEDVVQESFLAALPRWRAIAAMRSPAGYLHGICLHKAVGEARRRVVERRILGRLAAADRPCPPEELPGEAGPLWKEVRALPCRQAQVVALHYVLDLAVADVADILDCAEGTVKVHLHRARLALAVSLVREPTAPRRTGA